MPKQHIPQGVSPRQEGAKAPDSFMDLVRELGPRKANRQSMLDYHVSRRGEREFNDNNLLNIALRERVAEWMQKRETPAYEARMDEELRTHIEKMKALERQGYDAWRAFHDAL